MSAAKWVPDDGGLSDHAVELIAEHGTPVHLRLVDRDSGARRGACDRGLGEWWSGIASQVTCSDCLEVVHA